MHACLAAILWQNVNLAVGSRGATATWLTLTTRAAFALSSEQQPAAQMLLLTMLVHNNATEDKCTQEWPMQLNTPSL